MILGIGTDIIEIARIKKVVEKTPSFVLKIFTEKERQHFEKKCFKPETIAGIFAAKEAVSKALGTGFRDFAPQDIEIVSNHLGKPEVTLYNGAKKLSEEMAIHNVHITISHCKEYAVAYAAAEGGK